MSEMNEAEKYMIEQIRQGDSDTWTQMVNRYNGRLLAFAQNSLPQRADAEDIVQEAFIGFLKGLDNFRGQASLETYLFTILRRKIIDSYRSRASRITCLIQDVYKSSAQEQTTDVFGKIADSKPTASWYVSRDEQYELHRESLEKALRELVRGMKESFKFRDLEIIELLFYSQVPNKDVAKILEITEKNIAVKKHRVIKQVKEKINPKEYNADPLSPAFESMLSEIWESQRLSCPKRSTIGAYLLETLDEDWYNYVNFHLNTLGCHFCRANLEDLRQQQEESKQQTTFRQRIMESTVGFLKKS
ncbi:MAG: sigma-70 family RNA polymerase sigma factor [Phycisphaerae bacterium]|nr:sigma-70 family RNA polymerase sigma factor [Phycisphaerae bacterium]